MDNLSFNLEWYQVAFMMFIFLFLYFLFAIVYYVLITFCGLQLKKLLDKIPALNDKKDNIYVTALPFFIVAVIMLYIPILNIISGKTYTQIRGSGWTGFDMLWRSYFGSLVGYPVSMGCLCLTRYSFTNDWKIIGRLKNKRIIINFILWTLISISIQLIDSFLFHRIFYGLVYALLIVALTRIFLKIRNINKPIFEAKLTEPNL